MVIKLEKKKEDEKLMTVKELCEFLSVSDSTVRRYMEDPLFPAIKFGGEYRFYKSQVINYGEKRAKK